MQQPFKRTSSCFRQPTATQQDRHLHPLDIPSPCRRQHQQSFPQCTPQHHAQEPFYSPQQNNSQPEAHSPNFSFTFASPSPFHSPHSSPLVIPSPPPNDRPVQRRSDMPRPQQSVHSSQNHLSPCNSSSSSSVSSANAGFQQRPAPPPPPPRSRKNVRRPSRTEDRPQSSSPMRRPGNNTGGLPSASSRHSRRQSFVVTTSSKKQNRSSSRRSRSMSQANLEAYRETLQHLSATFEKSQEVEQKTGIALRENATHAIDYLDDRFLRETTRHERAWSEHVTSERKAWSEYVAGERREWSEYVADERRAFGEHRRLVMEQFGVRQKTLEDQREKNREASSKYREDVMEVAKNFLSGAGDGGSESESTLDLEFLDDDEEMEECVAGGAPSAHSEHL